MRLTFCVACGALDDLHQHHVIPRSAGGDDDESNVITLCRDCHFTMHERRSHGRYNHAQMVAAGIAAARDVRAVRIRTVRVQMVAIFVCVIVAGALAVAFWHSPVMPLLLLFGGIWLYLYLVPQIAIAGFLQGLFGGGRRRW
jgi:hypothetical protein